MTTANTDNADLEAQTFGGIVNEDVMQQIFDISSIPLPFTERVGSESSSNDRKEWLINTLPDPDIANAQIDGSDFGTAVDNLATRVSNFHQILTKDIAVSTRADNVDAIGAANTLAQQLMRFNQAIRRDFEAICLLNQASLADTGAAAGTLGGFPSWLETNALRGALGVDGGFNTTTGVVDAATAGTVRDLTETLVKDCADLVYKAGGNPTVAMSIPDVIRNLSTFMFDSSARIATLQRQADGIQEAQAIGSVNVFLTDHGVTLELVSNRLQQTYNTDTAADLFLIDPAFAAQSYLHNVRADQIGKPGLSDLRQLSMDATLVVNNEAAHGVIADIDYPEAVTA